MPETRNQLRLVISTTVTPCSMTSQSFPMRLAPRGLLVNRPIIINEHHFVAWWYLLRPVAIHVSQKTRGRARKSLV